MYRRFGFLQARLLLHKQDELRQLESELDQLDRQEDEPLALMSRELDLLRGGSIADVLSRIERKFKEYGLIYLHSSISDTFINIGYS